MGEEKEEKSKRTKGGRPSLYTEELADRICFLVATSNYGLPTICKQNPDLPDETTIRLWQHNKPGFFTKYAKAKLKQAELFAEEIISIADDMSNDSEYTKEGKEICNKEWVARSRLRIDTRKWLASKLLPKAFGDKLTIEQKTEENEKLKQEILELRKKLDKKNKKDY